MSNTTNTTDYYYGTDYYDYGGYYYKPHEWFAWSRTDLVLQVVLCEISTLSSALILYIIYKSPIKLRTTYHRIMALLSSFDILSSVPMALATLPIPSSYVPYKGLTLGTYGTCTAQGFLISFGFGGAMDTALCLAWYYVCSALGVSNRIVQNFYEPIVYTYIIVSAIVINSLLMSKGYFNIRPWSVYCGLSPVPSACWDGTKPATDVECAWPERPHPYFLMMDFFRGYIIFSYVMIVLAMIIIIFIVYRNERKYAHKDSSGDNGANETGQQRGTRLPTSLKQTRLIVRQALMYIFTFILTWILVLIPWNQDSPKWMDILESIFIPMQGLWNMLIFVYIKISLIREADQSIDSNWKALKTLLKNPDVVPDMVLSGMDNVIIASRPFQEENFADEGADEEDSPISQAADEKASNPSAYDDLSMDTPSKATSSAGMLSTASSERKSLYYYRRATGHPSGAVNISPFAPAGSSSAASSSGSSAGAGLVDHYSDHMQDVSVAPSESTGRDLISYGGLSNEMPKITED